MKVGREEERGFTLIELLVSITLFMIVAVAFYQVTFSGVSGSDTSRDVARVSEEARLGFNRMIRDTREAQELTYADSDEYRIWVDFDIDGNVDANAYEHVGFQFVDVDGDGVGRIDLVAYGASLSVPVASERGVLIDNVSVATDAGGTDLPLFTYVSNLLEYDTDNDGVATVEEIHADPDVAHSGVHNSANAAELDLISGVSFAFTVAAGDAETEFFSEADLRNKRFRDD